MAKYIEKLDKRMEDLTKALQIKRENSDYDFDEVKAVDMIIKFVIYFNQDEDENSVDGIYLYLNEDGIIINAEYFVKEDNDVTIISFDDDQLEIIIELFRDVFTINVD